MFKANNGRTVLAAGIVAGIVCALFTGPASALRWRWGDFNFSLTNNLTVGAIVRVEERDPGLVAKLENNPYLCPEDCIDLGGDYSPNTEARIDELVQAPGGFIAHLGDDGNLRFDQWDVASAVVTLDSELSVSWNGFRFTMTTLGFYDVVNADGEEYHPDNFLELRAPPGTQPKPELAARGSTALGVGPTRTAFQPENPDLSEAAEEMIGADFDILQAVLSTQFTLFGQRFSLAVGEQRIHWGIALFNVLGSLDMLNPINQNRLYRPGSPVAAVFEPTGIISLGTRFSRSISIQLVYQYDWERSVPAAGASLFGFIEAAAGGQYATLSLGQISAGKGAHFTNDLARVFTDTTLGLQVDHLSGRPGPGGQYGFKLDWYLADLNGGTQLSFYALNYHSRLPMISIIASNQSCLRQDISALPNVNLDSLVNQAGLSGVINRINQALGGVLGSINLPKSLNFLDNLSTSGLSSRALEALIACGGFDGSGTVANTLQRVFEPLQQALPGQGYSDEPLPAGTAIPVLDYPEDIHMFGISFQTKFGPWSVAGEYAYRPNQPFAVQPADVLFAGLQPALPEKDIQLLVGTIPSNRHAVPDYIATQYRNNPPTANEYIEGYIRLPMHTFDFTGLRIFGSGNWLGADQIVLALEFGGTWVPDLPEPDEVPIATLWLAGATHPSEGASGAADNTEDANPKSPATTLNPKEQTDNYATEFSAGLNMLLQLRYYNFLFGKTYLPQIALQWDVIGIAPFPIQNYIEGRKKLLFINTVRLTQSLKVRFTYNAFFGGEFNNLHDRDNIRFSLTYSF